MGMQAANAIRLKGQGRVTSFLRWMIKPPKIARTAPKRRVDPGSSYEPRVIDVVSSQDTRTHSTLERLKEIYHRYRHCLQFISSALAKTKETATGQNVSMETPMTIPVVKVMTLYIHGRSISSFRYTAEPAYVMSVAPKRMPPHGSP